MSDVTDPMNATKLEVNRRAFVGLSAGAAVLGPSTLKALAAGAELGKIHPPLVAENDPEITAGWVTLARPGKTIKAYQAAPKNAHAKTPGIVVTMHIWGVDTSIRDVVRRYAKLGYAAIAPDLYGRLGAAPAGDGATDYKPFVALENMLVDSQADGDLNAGAQWIKNRYPHGKIGITGFCMGGAIALRQAVDSPVFCAASVFYGKVRYATFGPPGENDGPVTRMALGYADEIRIPLCGNYGERDTSILAADVRELQRKLKALNAPNDIKIYPEAGHAFFDDQRNSYVATAATDAWKRTTAFFAKYLRA
ncbi:MAG: dienelactone hydrolase family protein [Candidatus Eremiobacteraeota bacterium]|nr:dienelactone hydrolase family protein [Candidatus Eremiobacteraeota bacterium]